MDSNSVDQGSEAGVDGSTSLSQLRKTDRRALTTALVAYPLPWTGDAGYKKAEVTAGGVELSQVDPKTMESKICRNLPESPATQRGVSGSIARASSMLFCAARMPASSCATVRHSCKPSARR